MDFNESVVGHCNPPPPLSLSLSLSLSLLRSYCTRTYSFDFASFFAHRHHSQRQIVIYLI